MTRPDLGAQFKRLSDLAPDLIKVKPREDYSYTYANGERQPCFVDAMLFIAKPHHRMQHETVATQDGPEGIWTLNERVHGARTREALEAYITARGWIWTVGSTGNHPRPHFAAVNGLAHEGATPLQALTAALIAALETAGCDCGLCRPCAELALTGAGA